MFVSEIASQLFAPPTSEVSPANFTEGDASQAVCISAKVSEVGGKTRALAVEGKEPQIKLPVESRKRNAADKNSQGKRQKLEEISFECMEGQVVRGKIREPEILSDEETDGEDDYHVMGRLPSSSGPTVSGSKEDGDSDGERSVDSGERTGGQGDADDEIEEISEGAKLPIFKSYHPNFVSPQEVPKSKAGSEKAVNSPVEAATVRGEETQVVEEDPLWNTPTPTPSIFRSLNSIGLEVAVEETGSECLPGRSKVEKTSGKKKGKMSSRSPQTEKLVVADEEEDQEEHLEGDDVEEIEKEPQRKKGKDKLKEKPKEDGKGDEDEGEKEIERSAKSKKKRQSKEVDDVAEAVNEVEKGSGVDQAKAKEPGNSRVKTRGQLQAEACSQQGQVEKKKKHRRKKD